MSANAPPPSGDLRQSDIRSSRSTGSRARRLLLLLASVREVGIVLFLAILIPIISLRQPRFFTVDNFRDIFLDIAIVSIVSIGQMMIIIARGIDLSVGSMLGLVAMVVGLMIRDKPAFPMVIAVLVGVGLGFLLGSINGLLVTKGRVPPIIATLGTLSIYRGLVIVVSQGEWVDAYRVPPAFVQITRSQFLGVPALLIYALIIAAIFHYFLNYVRTGRDIYAIGSNPLAASMAGIRSQRIIFLVFAITGTLAGLSGVLWASRFAAVANDTGTGFELQTVAAAVIGGVNIYGGSGTVPGVLLGALLMGIIVNALTITGISPFWRLTVQGIVILLAVIVDAVIQRRLRRVS
jgi:rhamnose transport system permease protein